MEHQVHTPDKLMGLSDSLLNHLRHYLNKYSLAFLFSTLRALIHFGPWRVVPQFLIRTFRPVVHTVDEHKTSLLGSLDTNTIAKEVRQNSISIAGMLPSEFVSHLQTITNCLPVDHYQLMHHIDKDVRRLSDDPAIKAVLRAYFKCEPVLLESTLMITAPDQDQTHKLNTQNKFHFDYAGWESLNVFVYLSDVTTESSYHVVAKGSHRHIGFHEILCGSLTDDEVLHRFGPSIQPIMGPAGTLFFENTEALHRRYPSNQRRVMLNMLYASHRNWLSHGRTSRQHIRNRALEYNRLRNLKNKNVA